MASTYEWLQAARAFLRARAPGQGMLEYGLIISVVSIAAVVLIMAMGPKVASMFSAGVAAFPSDRRRKTGLAPVDPREVLARVVALPVGVLESA